MTHLKLRKFLTGLLVIVMLIAFLKLAWNDEWYLIVIALSTCAGVWLQWSVTLDERLSIKQGDEDNG